ncbi:MAG: SRPBCC family protein [Vicinamibacterales bacterium]
MRSRRARRDDTRKALGGSAGIVVHESVTIHATPDELYRFWRSFENLPKAMSHLESVTDLGGGRSHWVARAHGLGRYEWEAEIINEEPDKLIGWRSLPGSDVTSAGSVNFDEAEAGRGTRVTVRLQYDPPAGKLGALVARAFGEDPAQQIRKDLRKLKQQLEAGEVATTRGQSAGVV